LRLQRPQDFGHSLLICSLVSQSAIPGIIMLAHDPLPGRTLSSHGPALGSTVVIVAVVDVVVAVVDVVVVVVAVVTGGHSPTSRCKLIPMQLSP
jgi:hypothetical protein